MSLERSGPPPARKTSRAPLDWSPLLDDAALSPGQWFKMPVPEGLSPGNVSGSLSFAVFKYVAEHAVRNGEIYFRFHEENAT